MKSWIYALLGKKLFSWQYWILQIEQQRLICAIAITRALPRAAATARFSCGM